MKWIPVEAEILDVRKERHRIRRGKSSRTEWFDVVEYRYRMPDTGQEVTATSALDTKDVAVPGQTTTVYLDPDDTSRSYYSPPVRWQSLRGCGCVLLGFPVMVAAVIGGVAAWYFLEWDLKVLFAVAFFLPLLAACGFALLALRRMETSLPDWPEVPATVTGAAKEPHPERPGRAQIWLTIHYRYQDHLGFERDGSGLFNHPRAAIKRGDQVTVRVDPMDGSRSVLQPVSPKVLKLEMALCAGLALFAVLVAISIVV